MTAGGLGIDLCSASEAVFVEAVGLEAQSVSSVDSKREDRCEFVGAISKPNSQRSQDPARWVPLGPSRGRARARARRLKHDRECSPRPYSEGQREFIRDISWVRTKPETSPRTSNPPSFLKFHFLHKFPRPPGSDRPKTAYTDADRRTPSAPSTSYRPRDRAPARRGSNSLAHKST